MLVTENRPLHAIRCSSTRQLVVHFCSCSNGACSTCQPVRAVLATFGGVQSGAKVNTTDGIELSASFA